ncbi:FAD-binding oxidoreductase [Candidatus Parcubacteria bacterium]|nr:FAD-binding oxidoreductase [Candidatus Parcubacteria bacterium]
MATTWEEEGTKRKKYPNLDKDISADIVVIGGGITGLLNAYLLSEAGQKVVLVEADELGNNATLRTTAFITQVIDTDYSKVADIFGTKEAKQVWESHGQAIDQIERIINKENISCEFVRCSDYLYASTKKQFESIQEEFRTYKELGFKGEIFTDGKALNFPNYGYIEIHNQAKFNPAQFIFGIAEAAEKQGVMIFEDTEALEITEDSQIRIKTHHGDITTGKVILATYKPFTNEKTHLKKAMYRSYILEIEIPKNTLKEAIYEDDSNPYYYFRIDSGKEKDRMIIGGEDHKDIFGKSLRKESFKGLEKYLDKILKNIKYKITKRWDGPILEPSDGLALIGEIKPNYYVATGFSGNGMTYSTISAILLRDLILARRNAWTSLYDPTRTILKPKRLASKAKDYIEEFFGGALKNLIS